MEIKNVKTLLPYNIQFFADENDSGNNQESNDENDSGNNDSLSNNDVNDNKGNGEKTFTQKQVTAMMAKEKREGKRSVLSALGFKDEEEAKKAVSLLNAMMDSQKSEDEKNNTKNKKIQDEKNDAENRAKLAEAKLECLTCGVDKESIDDVLAIAMPKVTEENTLEDILKEMKKNKRYSMFFNSSSSNGTGTPPGHSQKGNDEKGGFGKRLAEANKVETKKSTYF